MKPKILIVVDAENWAFDENAKEIKKNLNSFFNTAVLIPL